MLKQLMLPALCLSLFVACGGAEPDPVGTERQPIEEGDVDDDAAGDQDDGNVEDAAGDQDEGDVDTDADETNDDVDDGDAGDADDGDV